MDLRCFRDGANIELGMGKGSLDFCLEQLMVSYEFGKVKIWKRSTLVELLVRFGFSPSSGDPGGLHCPVKGRKSSSMKRKSKALCGNCMSPQSDLLVT